MKNREYRIVRSRSIPGQFEVQHRHQWWPFWLYTDTATTMQRARELANEHAENGGIVEVMGELPPANADD